MSKGRHVFVMIDVTFALRIQNSTAEIWRGRWPCYDFQTSWHDDLPRRHFGPCCPPFGHTRGLPQVRQEASVYWDNLRETVTAERCVRNRPDIPPPEARLFCNSPLTVRGGGNASSAAAIVIRVAARREERRKTCPRLVSPPAVAVCRRRRHGAGDQRKGCV